MKREHKINPFVYIGQDKSYSFIRDVTIKTENCDTYEGIFIENLQGLDFENISVVSYSDFFLSYMDKMGHRFEGVLEVKLNLANNKGNLRFGFNEDKEINSFALSCGPKIQQSIPNVDYSAYNLTRKIAQILINEKIASELLISRGLDRVAHDEKYKLLKDFYVRYARDQLLK